MNNLKKKMSLILSVIMVALAVFPIFTSMASSNTSDVSMSVKLNGVELEDTGSYKVKNGDKIYVKATSNISGAPVKFTGYYYANADTWKRETETVDVDGGDLTITVPTQTAGTRKTIMIEAVLTGNQGASDPTKRTGWQAYTLEWISDDDTISNKDVNVRYKGVYLTNGSTTIIENNRTLGLSATPENRVKKIYFKWDSEAMREVTTSPVNLELPSNFEVGTTHKLQVMALYDNGEKSSAKTFYITIKAPATSDEPVTPNEPVTPTNPTDSELDILPWEKDNNELSALSISLRNDSESDKANKNVYALGEKVTYFIDFKNGGKAIKDEVKISLELPLDFEVVSSDGGNVDYDKGLITWTYPNGMEKEYEGTKTIEIKYTSLGKKNVDSKTIYPLATISKDGKDVDNSAVINFIYRDEDTVITDTHEPYMYGDANATTFRPNDTITRAEGALVLTRILLGQSAIDNVKVTSVYPDLDQTYLEAQKAIIAATSYGIINGYTDGYYRPNQTMTRAEFMKIIATFIELNAEDDGIEGLEIKALEDSVKLYKDPVLRYAVNGTTVSNHWAIEEVSLLVRLNMTSVSKSNKNLRLDEGITRAEVAQLVNFFLLRAPAEVSSKTTTAFSDVNRKHDLFADIVEATRPAHDFTITEDGTEIAE